MPLEKKSLQEKPQKATKSNKATINKDKIGNYLRIGTEYYRKVKKPLVNDTANYLVKWKKETLKEDFRIAEISKVEKFVGFTFVPGHGNDYKEKIDGFYNQYEMLNSRPELGDCSKSLDFVKHIFGEQYELGLDYLALLYLKPEQILPILCLISEERNTGKSTFIKWLKSIFQGNMTINSNEEFRASFNSDWITKLIIGVEETLLEKKEDSERIKALSTGEVTKSHSKGVDKFEVPFYGKFVLCANNETKFIIIDQAEIRYWVRKIPVPERDETNLLEVLRGEINQFLYFLSERGIKSNKKSRMWFSPEDIETEALNRLKRDNRAGLEQEIETIVLNKIEDFNVQEIKLTLTDLWEELKHLRVSQSYIKRVLQENLNLKPGNSSTYKKYAWSIDPQNSADFVVSEIHAKGRYYTFTTAMFEKDEFDNSKIIENVFSQHNKLKAG
ncbi:MAG: helicase [Cyclobacteriaceae bacterium]|nr:helicase [Cyclobacteriaceae bacterium]